MYALILAGGSGTRFWPLSRRHHPKQLLALDGDRTLLRATVERLAPLVQPENVWVATTARLRDAIQAELPDVPAEQILIEPVARNTAPAIGWAVRSMPVRDEIVAVLPADHRVADEPAFRACLENAAEIARRDDRIMTLGVVPRWAETGYGYIEIGEGLEGDGGAAGPGGSRVARFTEKPDAPTAQGYLDGGKHLWNAGIFVFRGGRLLDSLATHAPEVAQGVEAMAAAPDRVDELYPTLPKISIDYAVAEKETDLGTLPLECGWDDLGSWKALAEVLSTGDGTDIIHGDALAVDGGGNLLWSDLGTIAVVGVEDLVVVRTGDAVLVVPRERAQDVRKIVDALEANQRNDLL